MHSIAPFNKVSDEGIHRTPQPKMGEWVPTRCAQGCEWRIVNLFQGVHTLPPGRGQQHPQNHFSNDPSAGSPTETLLRLLLPLNDQV
jgi:hypothetical protein